MYLLPKHVIKIINEYAKPITRANWRKGSNCNESFKYSKQLIYLHQTNLSMSAYKPYLHNINYNSI